MDETWRRIGRWSLVLALSLAIGCSSRAPVSGSGGSSGDAAGGDGGFAAGDCGTAGDMGTKCGTVGPVPIQAGASACTVVADLSGAADRNNIKIQDQSMVTIPYSTSNGWMFGDPAAPILLTGSYCTDAMAGRLTAVTILLGCGTWPLP